MGSTGHAPDQKIVLGRSLTAYHFPHSVVAVTAATGLTVPQVGARRPISVPLSQLAGVSLGSPDLSAKLGGSRFKIRLGSLPLLQ